MTKRLNAFVKGNNEEQQVVSSIRKGNNEEQQVVSSIRKANIKITGMNVS